MSSGHAWHRMELHCIADMVGQHLSTLGRVNVAGSCTCWAVWLCCPAHLVSSRVASSFLSSTVGCVSGPSTRL